MNIEHTQLDNDAKEQIADLKQPAIDLAKAIVRQKEFQTIATLLGTSILLSLLASAFLSISPVLFARGIDKFEIGSDHASESITLIVSSLIVFGISKLLTEQRWLIYQPAENKLLNSIREIYLQHVLSLPLEFHLNRSIGRLDSIVGQGMAGMQSISNILFVQLAQIIFDIVLTTTVLFIFVSIHISATVLVSILLYLIFLFAGTEYISQRLKIALGKTIEAQGAAGDAILNAEGIKALAVENTITSGYRNKLGLAHSAFVRFYSSRCLFGVLLVGILVAGFASAIWLAVADAAAERISIGALVLTNTCVLQMFRTMENFSFSYRGTRQSIEAVKRYLEVFAETAEHPQEHLIPIGSIDRIQLQNVGFKYRNERWAAKNVSFVVKRGVSTALVGKSGSGKSTIVRTIIKLLAPTCGQILVNGIDLNQLNGVDLRRKTSVVPQDAVMFKASFAFNIALTDRPDTELLWSAVKKAELAKLVQSLPEGIDTEIGERGFKLSGGERQRLAIARAIYRGSDLFIFDEATSALDQTTKAEILQLIRELVPNYCVLLITHDDSVANLADTVAVMNEAEAG